MQELDEMELLMARCEEEKRAMESEMKCMRSTASQATSQLMLAAEMVVRCLSQHLIRFLIALQILQSLSKYIGHTNS